MCACIWMVSTNLSLNNQTSWNKLYRILFLSHNERYTFHTGNNLDSLCKESKNYLCLNSTKFYFFSLNILTERLKKKKRKINCPEYRNSTMSLGQIYTSPTASYKEGTWSNCFFSPLFLLPMRRRRERRLLRWQENPLWEDAVRTQPARAIEETLLLQIPVPETSLLHRALGLVCLFSLINLGYCIYLLRSEV